VNRYLLDNRRPEAGERFAALAELFDPWTFRHLDDLGLGEGWRSLVVLAFIRLSSGLMSAGCLPRRDINLLEDQIQCVGMGDSQGIFGFRTRGGAPQLGMPFGR
jgi:hypothetical protein